MSVLSEILATKRTHVTRLKQRQPLDSIRREALAAAPALPFRAELSAGSGIRLIGEVKKASPSKGVIREHFEPVEIACAYVQGGASCLSVLTDEPYFQGSLAYLRAIRKAVSAPLLRKDFIVDPWQVAESRAAGADAILLIAAALPPEDLRLLLLEARSYGMEALVEVHDADELSEALASGACLIGINNRSLHTFATSLSVTEELAPKIPPDRGITLVSESGIFTRADAVRLERYGVKAMLVGESVMREPDVAAKVRELLGAVEP